MDLRLPFHLAAGYKSASQRARIASEAWGAENLFCCNCTSNTLRRETANTHVVDFLCPACSDNYQLKSTQRRFGGTITGANYARMMSAVLANRTPHFHLLHYELPSEFIKNLVVIPRFAISPSAIQKRNALGATARRANWIGYVFNLRVVPDLAKIALVREGEIIDRRTARAQFAKIGRIEALRPEQRGWSLDVLRCVELLPSAEFTTDQVYQFVPELSALHPANRHVPEKIRQQLQVLRDRGLLRQLGRGRWLRL
ncbi:MAG: hypothetical protein C0518_10430 [Opitutus sp.]|nr:hypothetical protein [Opitutus sp.]